MEAIKIANELFKTNKFQTHKQLEHKLEQIKLELKERMEGYDKRRIFHDQNLVCKYIRNNVYEVDKLGMNDMLHQYGLLMNLARIELKDNDKKREADAFTNPQTYHLRINAKMEKEAYDFSEYSDFDLVNEYNQAHQEYKRLETHIENAKFGIFKDKRLQEDKKAKFDFGSLTLAKNKLTYDIGAIYENLGLQYIIENSTANSEKLEEYMIKGFVNKKEVMQYKKLIDVRLKFVVISLSDENLVFGMMNNKTQRYVQESLAEVAVSMEE